MSQPYFELRDLHTSKVRAICAEIDDALDQLHAPTAGSQFEGEDVLRAQWLKLITLLDLPPTPALRACPHCERVGMLEATRCHHCWAELPIAVAADELATI